jgi:hypothetical protein
MTTTKLDTWTGYLTTNCECTFYNDETDEIEPVTECDGECFTMDKESSLELVEQWLERNGNPEAALISGAKMTWQSLSGYAIERNTNSEKLAEQILNALMLNGDFTITLELTGKDLTARRASHDEPMGASFTITPAKVCQGWNECLAIDNLQELDGAKFCAWCLDLELANR